MPLAASARQLDPAFPTARGILLQLPDVARLVQHMARTPFIVLSLHLSFSAKVAELLIRQWQVAHRTPLAKGPNCPKMVEILRDLAPGSGACPTLPGAWSRLSLSLSLSLPPPPFPFRKYLFSLFRPGKCQKLREYYELNNCDIA